MTVEFVLNAEPRGDQGKGASRRLRREGKVPAILYGGGREPMPITLIHSELLKQLEHEAFYSHVLTVNLGGNAEKAVLRDLQRHPAKPLILHVDLQRVTEGKKIRVHVPLHFVNEDNCVGVKQGGGVLSRNLVEVEIQCLPQDLPEYIEVDVADLNVGEVIHLSELALPPGVELVELLQGEEHDNAVVTVLKSRGTAADDGEESEGGEAEAGAE